MSDLCEIYDRPFFEMHVAWRSEYEAIASLLLRTLEFSSVLDLGCGNGFVIAKLAAIGKVVTGVDGSFHVLGAIPPNLTGRVHILDLTKPVRLGRYDLVICSEVAEHLAACHAETLVENVCENSGGKIFFTAATPGQGGHHHINEQPHSYWITAFADRGYFLDQTATLTIRHGIFEAVKVAWWFARNSMIFQN